MAINYVKIAENTKKEIAKIDVKLDKYLKIVEDLEEQRKSRVMFLLSTERITGQSHVEGTDRANHLEEKSLKSAIVEIVTRKGRANASDVDTEIIRAGLKFIDGDKSPNVSKIRNIMSQLGKSGILHKVANGTYIRAGADDRSAPGAKLTTFNYELTRKLKSGTRLTEGSIEAVDRDTAIGMIRVRHPGNKIKQVVLA